MANEIAEVNGIRLRDNLSISRLAREMGLERSGLYRVLKTPGRRPREGTLYRMQEWLKKRKATTARKSSKSSPARASL